MRVAATNFKATLHSRVAKLDAVTVIELNLSVLGGGDVATTVPSSLPESHSAPSYMLNLYKVLGQSAESEVSY